VSRRIKLTAAWSALAIASIFVLIVLAVDKYEAELEKINWPLVSLISVFVFGALTIYRWNADLPRYNLIELVMNPKTGKADPYRHLLFLFAGLTVWAIVQVVLNKQWGSLTALLLPSLGFFVAKPTVDGFADAWASRPAKAADSAGNLQQVINAPSADTVVAPAPAEAATDVGVSKPMG